MIFGTKQEMFETMVRGLASQQWVRSEGNGGCEYRGGEGRKCALGWLIPDEVWAVLGSCDTADGFNPNSVDARTLFAHAINRGVLARYPSEDVMQFIANTQAAHDGSVTPAVMRELFVRLGERYRLTWPSDVPEFEQL